MNIFKTLLIVIPFLLPVKILAQETDPNCFINEDMVNRILQEVEKKNPQAISSLPECFKLNHELILKAAIIDPTQFQYAAPTLKEDENFVRRMLKVSPQILPFASPKLRADQDFMERATYISRTALQYADPNMMDNRLFMKKMIKIDSKNYMFASGRLREVPEFAEMAFSDNGLLLEYAPSKIKNDKRLVTIALKSNSSAFEFASENLKKDPELIKISTVKTSIKSKKDLEDFLQKNYITADKKKNLGLVISNQAKFFPKNKFIDRNYVTKWQRGLVFHDDRIGEDLRLIAADSRNYPILWKEDFSKYPDLVKKIENFFLKHNIDRITIDKLSTTYLWKIKAKPLTLAFNLYLLRDSKDVDLGSDFSDVTSLTAIVQKQKNHWEMTVVEVIFDSEIKIDISYPNGHKKHVLWDLCRVDKNDVNPKLVFKVEDKFKEYFEIFEEQNGGKYQMIDRFEPKF